MEIENLLEYQSKDFEIFKLERMLYQGDDKKMIDEMIKKVKETKAKSLQLEKNATDLIFEFENLKKSFDENMQKLNLMTNSNIEKLSQADLLSFETAINAITNNLNLIENKLAFFAKNISTILTNFENAKRMYNKSREEYSKHKSLYDLQYGEIKPQIEKMQKDLLKLEKNIDAKLLAKYKAKRQDKKFPILVPYMNGDCGGCQMQLSYAIVNKLKEEGLVECEHCRRIIYLK